MHLGLVRKYERALEEDKRLKVELANKKQELEELQVILSTDYVDLLEQAKFQYNRELERLQQKQDMELYALIEQVIHEKELTHVAEILKMLHKLKKLRPSTDLPRYYLKERELFLSKQKRYLGGEDVKRWTAFMRSHFYSFLFQLRTLFGEEADVVIRESALVPRLIGEYLSVVRRSLPSLKSSLEYSTLWTLLTLTDRALSQVGAPFIVLLVSFIRDAYVRHLMLKGVIDGNHECTGWDLMACLNEWRHFRPSFATAAIRVQITRRLAKKEYTEEQMTVISKALKKLSGDDDY